MLHTFASSWFLVPRHHFSRSDRLHGAGDEGDASGGQHIAGVTVKLTGGEEGGGLQAVRLVAVGLQRSGAA